MSNAASLVEMDSFNTASLVEMDSFNAASLVEIDSFRNQASAGLISAICRNVMEFCDLHFWYPGWIIFSTAWKITSGKI